MCHCTHTASCAKFCTRKTHLAFVCCRTKHSSALRSQASDNHCTALDRRTRELLKYRDSVFLLASSLFSVRNVSHGVVKASSPLSPPICVNRNTMSGSLQGGCEEQRGWYVQQPHCDSDMALLWVLLWGLKVVQLLGPVLRRRIQN
jgi:hypothetical protein